MKRFVLIVAVAVACGCKKPGPPDAGVTAAPEASGAAVGWSEAKVLAYLELQRGLAAGLEPLAGPDGGSGRIRTDEELAYEEGKLRRASGLSEQEIDTLNRLTAALVTRDTMAKISQLQAEQAELARLRAEVPDGSVPEVDQALEVLAERKKREAAMPEERARFGNALVDLALPHRQALISNWGALMHAAQEFGETREGEH
jgi:hypothetical protein